MKNNYALTLLTILLIKLSLIISCTPGLQKQKEDDFSVRIGGPIPHELFINLAKPGIPLNAPKPIDGDISIPQYFFSKFIDDEKILWKLGTNYSTSSYRTNPELVVDSVIAEVLVTSKGSVAWINIKRSSDNDSFNSIVIDALKQTVFDPAYQKGNPVGCLVGIYVYMFKINRNTDFINYINDHFFTIERIMRNDASTNPSITWELSISSSVIWEGNDIISTSDNGYIIFGGKSGYKLRKPAVLKIDSMGNKEWFNTISDTTNDWIYAACETKDGNYLITGSSRDTSKFYGDDMLIMKIDSKGKRVWKQIYGTDFDDHLNRIIPTNDGNYVAVGTFNYRYDSPSTVFQEMAIIKVNADGESLWLKSLSTPNNSWIEVLNDIVETDKGDLVVTGTTQMKSDSENIQAYVAKLTSSGSVIWETTLGENNINYSGERIVKTSDGGYCVLTNRGLTGAEDMSGDFKIALFKIDKNGNIEWHSILKTIKEGTPLRGNSIISTANGEYIIAGSIRIKKGNNPKVYVSSPVVFKVDNSGSLVSSVIIDNRYWSTPGEKYADGARINIDNMNNIILTTDKHIIAIGKSNKDFWVGKLKLIE